MRDRFISYETGGKVNKMTLTPFSDMKSAIVLQQPLFKLAQEQLPVSITEEYRLLVIAPLDDMVRLAGKGQTWLAGHGATS